jgi:anhydro-N-acetylmuramic acid kinase
MPDQVILCGGGALNPTLVRMLREELGRMPARPRRNKPGDGSGKAAHRAGMAAALAPPAVVTAADYGIAPQAKEAVSFALLAAATIRGQPNNVPSATGACRGVVLGKIVSGR